MENMIKIPEMTKEDKNAALRYIKYGFILTLKEVGEATGLNKDEILTKLETLGYIKPWDKNPSYKFAVKGDNQPIEYSVVSFKYKKGGYKDYGSGTLWLFKPYIISVLLGQEPEIEKSETIYIMCEDEYNRVSEYIKSVIERLDFENFMLSGEEVYRNIMRMLTR